jgi:DNA-binding NarL/FixJ family response regulator
MGAHMPSSNGEISTLSAASFLLVEAEPRLGSHLTRRLMRYGAITSVPSLRAARRTIQDRRFTGMLVDLNLPDGSGIDVVALDRMLHEPPTPALAFTTGCTNREVNEACRLNVRFAMVPMPWSVVHHFVRESTEQWTVHDDVESGTAAPNVAAVFERHVREVATRYGLARCEQSILRASLQGLAPKEYAATRGISMNTYKTEARTLINKVRVTAVAEIRDRILRTLSGT